MKINLVLSKPKLGILIIILFIGSTSCQKRDQHDDHSIVRFEKLVFSFPTSVLSDSIRIHHKELIPFFRVFNEEVIRIGPDTLPGYNEQLNRFVNDSLMNHVYQTITRSAGIYDKKCLEIRDALKRWSEKTGNAHPDYLVTFQSGFNQSFIALPGILGIGIDHYLGADCNFYQGLGLPEYIRKDMKPENLPGDAVRAWVYSEIPAPSTDVVFLDRMIYEGMVYYITSRLLPEISEGVLFHYTEDQLRWCRSQEKAMWKYMAEQKVLFSSERLTIRKFIEEAPFTRDFGNESPGRVGTWIGFRIVSSYVKSSGISLSDLIKISSAKEILSGSKYHP
ncbi:MAG: hypothetical protein WC699_18000 [Bacteroidales bacterium]|jgi:hypothetical protein